MDLFQAGSESTSMTLTWIILYMMAYPDIQKKLHDEIDNVMGSRTPLLSDRPKWEFYKKKTI